MKNKKTKIKISEKLKTKYGISKINIRKGDTVTIISGKESKTKNSGKIIKVFPQKGTVTIEKIVIYKAKKTQVAKPIHTSNLIITDLNLTDKTRLKNIKKKVTIK